MKRLELELETNVKLFGNFVLSCANEAVPSVSGYNDAEQGDAITVEDPPKGENSRHLD